MKYITGLLLFFILMITGCKTIDIKEKAELRGNVLYKQMLKDSEALKTIQTSGSMMITGNENIPAVYIKFEMTADLIKKESILKLSVLSKPLIDLLMTENTITLINHTEKQFIDLPVADVDFSKVLGINFDPTEIAYLLLGRIPYSENMQLVNFTAEKNSSIMNITDETTNFFIEFGKDEKISSLKLENQFFDKLVIDFISYDEATNNLPQKIKASSEDKKITITFLIRNAVTNEEINGGFTTPADYKKIEKIDEIKIKLK